MKNKMTKLEKYIDLIYKLEKTKYLTSDSFDYPDRTYIYLDYKFLKPIRIVSFGDITSEFNINIYKDAEFRAVNRNFENITHLNQH